MREIASDSVAATRVTRRRSPRLNVPRSRLKASAPHAPPRRLRGAINTSWWTGGCWRPMNKVKSSTFQRPPLGALKRISACGLPGWSRAMHPYDASKKSCVSRNV